jgi:hypothetical protein
MQLVRSIASRNLTLELLWTGSKRPDPGRLCCSGRLGGVQSLTLRVHWTGKGKGKGCPESGRMVCSGRFKASKVKQSDLCASDDC